MQGKWKGIKKNVSSRRKNAKKLCNSLENVKGISFTPYTDNNSYFLFQILFDKIIDRDMILFALKEQGIGVSIHYATPVPLMSYYRDKYSFKEGDYPNAEMYANQSISLPIHPKLSEDDMNYIAFNIKKSLTEQTNET